MTLHDGIVLQPEPVQHDLVHPHAHARRSHAVAREQASLPRLSGGRVAVSMCQRCRPRLFCRRATGLTWLTMQSTALLIASLIRGNREERKRNTHIGCLFSTFTSQP